MYTVELAVFNNTSDGANLIDYVAPAFTMEVLECVSEDRLGLTRGPGLVSCNFRFHEH
jgi:hypothetical protein